MPLDNIKTRMQAAGAETRYRNSLDCLVKVSAIGVDNTRFAVSLQ
jgi:hypothetical protein